MFIEDYAKIASRVGRFDRAVVAWDTTRTGVRRGHVVITFNTEGTR